MQRATQVPVVHSVSFGYDDLDEWKASCGYGGKVEGHIYGRNTNPTVAVLRGEAEDSGRGPRPRPASRPAWPRSATPLFTLLELGHAAWSR